MSPANRAPFTLVAALVGVILAGLMPATVLAVNSPPVALDDPGADCQPPTSFGGAYPIPEDLVNSVIPGVPWSTSYITLITPCGLLSNDSDPDGDPLTWEIVTPPAHGDAIKGGDDLGGWFGYAPDPNYATKAGDQPGGTWISDSFTYRVSDGLTWSAPATMAFWIAPINDPPTFGPGPPVVTVGEDSVPHDAPWATNVLPGPPDESDQTVHFDVQTDLSGVPNLFAVPPAMDAAGNLSFTPNPDEFGLVHVTVTAIDDGGLDNINKQGLPNTPGADDTSDPVTFDIDVLPDNVTAVDDAATLPEDPDPGPWQIDVLGNDTHPGGSSITAVTQGTLGLVTIAVDSQSVLYMPDPDANGDDTFTYTLDDGAGSADTATVHVTITPVNDPPLAGNDPVFIKTNGPAKAIDVLGNDTDVDGDTLTITGTGPAVKGVVTITGGGTGLTYQPNPDETGGDSFTYTIGDGHGGSASGSVLVTIADNGSPNASDDSLTVLEDDPATAVDVLAGDSDPDGDPLLITDTSTPAKGTVVITGGETGLTYKPDKDANGADSFTYTISDGAGGTDTATVNVTITPQNDDPVANTDTLVISEDAAATAVPVLSNDTDVDGDTPTITGNDGRRQGGRGRHRRRDGVDLQAERQCERVGLVHLHHQRWPQRGRDRDRQRDDQPGQRQADARNDTAFTVPQGSGAGSLAVLGQRHRPRRRHAAHHRARRTAPTGRSSSPVAGRA